MSDNSIGEATANRVRIILPIPHKNLSPNARPHWAAKAKAVKQYREQSGMTAMVVMRSAGIKPPEWEYAVADVSFYFKTAAHRDDDNAMASLKAAFDGLADAHVIVNDRGLHPNLVEMSVDKRNPRVEIVVREMR